MSKPAIVLVHGAWADASCWNGVIVQLQAAGYAVYAPPNPLRGLASDAALIAGLLTHIGGPVVLVGLVRRFCHQRRLGKQRQCKSPRLHRRVRP
jgi:hypothetical protein